MILQASIFLSILSLLAADPNCTSIIADSERVTEDFPEIVVHGVHSITLENIREYFSPDATEDNGIPVVNFNLTQPELVLPSAPSIPLTNPFTSPTMDAVDQVLSHMTDNDWDIRNAPPLERLVHALHMIEVWETAAPHYKKWTRKVEKIKVKDDLKMLCPCLKDVKETGVMEQMTSLARKMRDTRKVWRYGPCASYGGGGGGGGGGLQPIFAPRKKRAPIMYQPPCGWQQAMRSHGEAVENPDTHSTNLTTEAEWDIWKTNMDMTPERKSKSKQLALFIYCALNY